ncbi:DUF6768 family protein [Aurantiacibacter aquimixticola]|uniref:Uncharacterized protein n=1 Tax=Aurantiacibacter aquimixticola TaxID=1958945 RepID=A0A419RQD0_9SPHN|nr:DUF6768 family protein [Aurantiacibacter aquimixticola]RJY07981.1 hypothetical protein D6201_00180 [Aurantiacibacter aquimixticola]
MTDTDNGIRDILDADDKAFLNELESDRGMFRQIGDSMAGPMGGWTKLVFAMSVVFGLLLIFCFYMVFTSHEPWEHLMWAIAALAVLVIQGFTKNWLFQRMNMLSILREVKRLQVQVALLSEERK